MVQRQVTPLLTRCARDLLDINTNLLQELVFLISTNSDLNNTINKLQKEVDYLRYYSHYELGQARDTNDRTR